MPDQNTPQESSGLTLQDLILVAQIIQLSSAKGIFRAEDLQPVGSLYTRLMAFLESAGAITRTTAPESAPAPAEQPAPADAAPAEATTAKEKKNVKARR